MNRRFEILRWILLQIFAAALTSAAGRSPWGWLWISLAQVPVFFLVARTRTITGALLIGLTQGALFVTVTLPWIPDAFRSYFGFSRGSAFLLGAFLSPLIEPQFALWAPFRFWIQRRFPSGSLIRFLAPALFFVICEAWVPRFLADSISFPLLEQKYLAQVADLAGTLGLTLLVCLLSEWFWWLHDCLDRAKRSALVLATSGTAALILASAFYGWVRLEAVNRLIESAPQATRILVAQPHLTHEERIEASQQREGSMERRVESLISLTERGFAKTGSHDWILWPETAIPNRYLEPSTASESRAMERLEAWLTRLRVPLVFGAHEQNDEGLFNTLHLLTPRASSEASSEMDVQAYRKALLFPFGEQTPGWLPEWGRSWFGGVTEFQAGPGPRILNMSTRGGVVAIQPILCYEVGFPDFVRAGANQGSQLIVNATNLGWFENPLASHYHFMSARFRSIENRLPQVVASVSGHSGVILPDGSVVKVSAHGVADSFLATVPLVQSPFTLFKAWGAYWFGYVCAGLLLALLAYQRLRHRGVVAVGAE